MCYAGKAFLSKAIARWVHEEGLSLDVCTGGELAVAEAVDFPPERITFHGNNKSIAELRRAVAYGVGRVAVDSREEIERLARVAREAGARQRVYIRVTPGVEAHTHEYVATGQEDQKFGFSLSSGAAEAAVAQVLKHPELELVGLHGDLILGVRDTSTQVFVKQRGVPRAQDNRLAIDLVYGRQRRGSIPAVVDQAPHTAAGEQLHAFGLAQGLQHTPGTHSGVGRSRTARRIEIGFIVWHSSKP